MSLKTKKFVFEISIDAVPHTPETAKEIYGSDYFNSDFGIQSHASELMYEVLKDALAHCMWLEIKHMVKCGCDPDEMNETDRNYHDYIQKKTRVVEEVIESYKFVRMEEKDA